MFVLEANFECPSNTLNSALGKVSNGDSFQSTGCSSLSIECSEASNSCFELVIGLQNTTKVYTCTVAQATVSSPMQMQATQLTTSV